jgi:phage terminase large subunit GpA-like protein
LLYRLATTLWKQVPQTPPDEWAEDNRIYPESAGIPGPRDPHITPYMVPWARAIHEAKTYRRYVAVTAAQSGKTDSILDVMGARLDQRPAPILYVGPTRAFLTDQFEPRLMALLDEAETLKHKVIRGRRMKKTLKWVAGVRVRLAHAGSSSALKSDPAALAFIDEFDEMYRSVMGQGDVLGLVEARGITYADFVTAVTSTPSKGLVDIELDPESGLEFWRAVDTDGIESPIWKLWQEGTRYHWAWPCLQCGEYFIPRFRLLKWPNRGTPSQARNDTTLMCPKCGFPHKDSEHKTKMNARGVYVAPGQKVSTEGVVSGDPPETPTYSVWISGLASPFVSWGQRVETYLTAIMSGDEDRVQTAMNAGFGELYTLTGNGDVPEWQEIMERRHPYRRGELPAGVLRIVMGVDVQRLSLIYSIRGYGSRGTSWLLDWGQLYGHTDDDQVWSDLTDLMMTPIGGMHIEKVFIDSGFRPNKPDSGDEHKVYEFCRRYTWMAHPTKGRDVMSPPYRVTKIEVKPSGKKAVYSINLTHVSTDFFKSLVLSRIRTPMDQPGSFFVPEDIDEDYCRQLVSEVRIVNKQTGKPEWIQRSRLNHFFDCEALCAAAAYTLNVQRIPEGVRRDDGSSHVQSPSDQPPEEPPPAMPPAAAAPTNLRSRFAHLSHTFNR